MQRTLVALDDRQGGSVSQRNLNSRRRLRQAGRLWRRALHAYQDADLFCLEINGLIQALRSVTWLLQNELKLQPDFAQWYAVWQGRLRADPVSRWLVEARNQIEKEGDLDLRSTASVAVIASWLAAPYEELEVPPLLSAHAIAALIAERDIPSELREAGLLKVERRWVTATLPDQELLEACSHVGSLLDELVTEAEARFPGQSAPTPPEGAWGAGDLVASREARTAYLHLRSGEFVRVATAPAPVLPDPDKAVRDRYGDLFAKPFPGGSFEDRCRSHHEIGRRMLETDGHHQAIAILLRDGRRIGFIALELADQQAKYLVMDELAELVRRQQADEVIVSTEIWMALAQPGGADEQTRPVDRVDRTEAFVTQAVARSGENLTLVTPFTRDGLRIVLSAAQTSVGFPQALLPILRVWS
jgi:hypothetical protein